MLVRVTLLEAGEGQSASVIEGDIVHVLDSERNGIVVTLPETGQLRVLNTHIHNAIAARNAAAEAEAARLAAITSYNPDPASPALYTRDPSNDRPL